MPRFATLTLPLLLLAAAPAQSADRKFDPDASAKAVAPFLDDSVMVVAHLDLTRLDAGGVVEWFGKMMKAKPEEIAEPKKMLTNLAQGLTKAGVKDVYFVFGGSPMEGPIAFVVMPLEQGADVKAIAKALGDTVGGIGFDVETINKAAVVASERDRTRLKKIKPVARPELAKAFAAAGDGVAHLAVIASENLRAQIEKDEPNLPKELGGGSIKVITRGGQWAAVGLEAPPKFKATVVVQATDKNAAKELHALAEKLPKVMAKEQPFRDLLPNAEKTLQRFVPKLDGDRLTLTVDEKQLASVVGTIADNARTEAPRVASSNNMKQIELAMHSYHDVMGALPAVANFDKQGKPLLSWRVHILPYIEEQQLYQQFKLDEPWDSENNKKLIAKMPRTYANPSSPKLAADGKTTYLLPVHKEAVFTGDKTGIRLTDIKDGTSLTVMLVDAADDAAVIWTKPDDLKLDPKDPTKGLIARHKDNYLLGFADGSVRLVPKTVDKKTLWAIFTRAGGEDVKLP
jgi:hypothetical protein